ncbi:UNVERIFIED_CONTAM: hypothetical protein NCL1_63148 [Trichonephila clavipes]
MYSCLRKASYLWASRLSLKEANYFYIFVFSTGKSLIMNKYSVFVKYATRLSFTVVILMYLNTFIARKSCMFEIYALRLSNSYDAFYLNSNIKRYLCIHTQEKPYICEICELGFSESELFKDIYVFI